MEDERHSATVDRANDWVSKISQLVSLNATSSNGLAQSLADAIRNMATQYPVTTIGGMSALGQPMGMSQANPFWMALANKADLAADYLASVNRAKTDYLVSSPRITNRGPDNIGGVISEWTGMLQHQADLQISQSAATRDYNKATVETAGQRDRTLANARTNLAAAKGTWEQGLVSQTDTNTTVEKPSLDPPTTQPPSESSTARQLSTLFSGGLVSAEPQQPQTGGNNNQTPDRNLEEIPINETPAPIDPPPVWSPPSLAELAPDLSSITMNVPVGLPPVPEAALGPKPQTPSVAPLTELPETGLLVGNADWDKLADQLEALRARYESNERLREKIDAVRRIFARLYSASGTSITLTPEETAQLHAALSGEGGVLGLLAGDYVNEFGWANFIDSRPLESSAAIDALARLSQSGVHDPLAGQGLVPVDLIAESLQANIDRLRENYRPSVGDLTYFVPFGGAAMQAQDMLAELEAAIRIESGKGSSYDFFLVARFIVRQEIQSSQNWTDWTQDGLAAIPATLLEFMSSASIARGIVGTATKEAGEAAMKRLLRRMLFVTVQTAANPQRIMKGTFEGMMADTDHAWFSALWRSFASNWLSTVSEYSGAIFSRIPGVGRLTGFAPFNSSAMGRMYGQMGIHPLFGELMENRVDELLHGLTGLSDRWGRSGEILFGEGRGRVEGLKFLFGELLLAFAGRSFGAGIPTLGSWATTPAMIKPKYSPLTQAWNLLTPLARMRGYDRLTQVVDFVYVSLFTKAEGQHPEWRIETDGKVWIILPADFFARSLYDQWITGLHELLHAEDGNSVNDWSMLDNNQSSLFYAVREAITDFEAHMTLHEWLWGSLEGIRTDETRGYAHDRLLEYDPTYEYRDVIRLWVHWEYLRSLMR